MNEWITWECMTVRFDKTGTAILTMTYSPRSVSLTNHGSADSSTLFNQSPLLPTDWIKSQPLGTRNFPKHYRLASDHLLLFFSPSSSSPFFFLHCRLSPEHARMAPRILKKICTTDEDPSTYLNLSFAVAIIAYLIPTNTQKSIWMRLANAHWKLSTAQRQYRTKYMESRIFVHQARQMPQVIRKPFRIKIPPVKTLHLLPFLFPYNWDWPVVKKTSRISKDFPDIAWDRSPVTTHDCFLFDTAQLLPHLHISGLILRYDEVSLRFPLVFFCWWRISLRGNRALLGIVATTIYWGWRRESGRP